MYDNRLSVRFLMALAACAAAPSASAQVASALLREGDPMPAAGAGHAVTNINITAVNGVTGYSAMTFTSDGVTTLNHAWGAPTFAAVPGLLFSEGTYGMYLQTSWEGFFGMDDAGMIAYSPSCNDLVGGGIGLDSAFQNAVALAVEGDPIPGLPGTVYRFNSRVGSTHNGIAYWIGGINDATSGASLGTGLFDTALGLRIKNGDVLPGIGTIDVANLDFDVRYSPLGSHFILPIDTTGSTATDVYMCIDGAPVFANGLIVQEGMPVGAVNGGLPGENWSSFDYFSIDEAGNWWSTGDTSAATSSDEFIVRNGRILYREGTAVDGGVAPAGSIDGMWANTAGDVAYVWDGNDGSGAVESLFMNSKRLLKLGDAVDLDGDGVVEPNSILSDFSGSVLVTIGSDRRIYFPALVDTLGTPSTSDDTEALFTILDPCGSVRKVGVGCVGTGGLAPSLRLEGCSMVGDNVTLGIQNGQPGAMSLVLFSGSQADAAIGGGCFLYLGSLLPPSFTVPLDGSGNLSSPVLMPALPTPLNFFMQAFCADAGHPLGFTATNGLDITVE